MFREVKHRAITLLVALALAGAGASLTLTSAQAQESVSLTCSPPLGVLVPGQAHTWNCTVSGMRPGQTAEIAVTYRSQGRDFNDPKRGTFTAPGADFSLTHSATVPLSLAGRTKDVTVYLGLWSGSNGLAWTSVAADLQTLETPSIPETPSPDPVKTNRESVSLTCSPPLGVLVPGQTHTWHCTVSGMRPRQTAEIAVTYRSQGHNFNDPKRGSFTAPGADFSLTHSATVPLSLAGRTKDVTVYLGLWSGSNGLAWTSVAADLQTLETPSIPETPSPDPVNEQGESPGQQAPVLPETGPSIDPVNDVADRNSIEFISVRHATLDCVWPDGWGAERAYNFEIWALTVAGEPLDDCQAWWLENSGWLGEKIVEAWGWLSPIAAFHRFADALERCDWDYSEQECDEVELALSTADAVLFFLPIGRAGAIAKGLVPVRVVQSGRLVITYVTKSHLSRMVASYGLDGAKIYPHRNAKYFGNVLGDLIYSPYTHIRQASAVKLQQVQNLPPGTELISFSEWRYGRTIEGLFTRSASGIYTFVPVVSGETFRRMNKTKLTQLVDDTIALSDRPRPLYNFLIVNDTLAGGIPTHRIEELQHIVNIRYDVGASVKVVSINSLGK